MADVWTREDGFVVSDDPARLDIETIHAFLAGSYWATNIPREVVERSVKNSITFGVYAPTPAGGERQVGFARVISDRATFAYLADVFIIDDYRGRGLSKFLMASILAHPELQNLRQWLLMTGDAHGLYAKYGFTVTKTPERVMQMRPTPTYDPNFVPLREKSENA